MVADKKMHPPFDLIHLGGETTVTGSCHLIRLSGGGDHVVSLDDMPVKPRDIDYLFITHAHIDHIGRIPELIDAGFQGEIICTHPTKALLGPMLDDGLSFTDYSDNEKKKILSKIDELSWGFEYNETFSLNKRISFKLKNAGHILGSCFIRFELPGIAGEKYTVIFSGDLGFFYNFG